MLGFWSVESGIAVMNADKEIRSMRQLYMNTLCYWDSVSAICDSVSRRYTNPWWRRSAVPASCSLVIRGDSYPNLNDALLRSSLDPRRRFGVRRLYLESCRGSAGCAVTPNYSLVSALWNELDFGGRRYTTTWWRRSAAPASCSLITHGRLCSCGEYEDGWSRRSAERWPDSAYLRVRRSYKPTADIVLVR